MDGATLQALTPGYKTSEFWVTVATVLGGLINQSGVLGSHTIDPQMEAAIAGMVATYVLSRTAIKASHATAAAKVSVAGAAPTTGSTTTTVNNVTKE